MAELSKYDLLINDLKLIEAQISTVNSKLKDSAERNIEFEKKLSQLEEENNELKKKLGRYEKEFEKLKTDTEINILNSLNLKERENLKAKLQNLLTRIDYHLSADSHRRLDEVDRQV